MRVTSFLRELLLCFPSLPGTVRTVGGASVPTGPLVGLLVGLAQTCCGDCASGKQTSHPEWPIASPKACKLFGALGKRENPHLVACLYWDLCSHLTLHGSPCWGWGGGRSENKVEEKGRGMSPGTHAPARKLGCAGGLRSRPQHRPLGTPGHWAAGRACLLLMGLAQTPRVSGKSFTSTVSPPSPRHSPPPPDDTIALSSAKDSSWS